MTKKSNGKKKKKKITYFMCQHCRKELPRKEMKLDNFFKDRVCKEKFEQRFNEMIQKGEMKFKAWASENFTDEEVLSFSKRYNRYAQPG